MKIEGGFFEQSPGEDFIRFRAFPKIGAYYVSSKNFVLGIGEVDLYIRKVPPFEVIYNYFMGFTALKSTKQQDICMSLFYDPYFNEFYETLKKDYAIISENRKIFLLKNFLLWITAPSTYVLFDKFMDNDTKEYYFKNNIFYKSKELVNLLNLSNPQT